MLSLDAALARYESQFTPYKKGRVQESYRIYAWRRDRLSTRKLDTLRTFDFAAWRDEQLERGLSPSTIRNCLTIISQVYVIAASEWGFEQLTNPIDKLRLPSLGDGRTRRLVEGEAEKLLGTSDQALSHLISLALETAMRQGELLALRWSDISMPYILLPTSKNGRGRDIPLSSRAKAAIAGLRSDNVLVSPYNFSMLRKRWVKLLAATHIVDLHWHDLRHEAISRLFEKGLTTEEVMLISGHRTYSSLARYTHLKASSVINKLG